MLTKYIFIPLFLCLPVIASAGAVESLLDQYRQQGAEQFTATTGKARWTQVNQQADGEKRSCSDCHGSDLSRAGKHAKTGKRIEPMAPSVNPERLSDMAKIEKWFKRNCKWTLGRSCTAQEKGDFLVFLQQQ